jgi:hypothetical protein
MCRISDAVTHPKVPNWITQSRDEVAEAELEAASIHLTYMSLVTENPEQYPPSVYGDYNWHEYWWRKHQEAAWFCSPVYTERKLGK